VFNADGVTVVGAVDGIIDDDARKFDLVRDK
jgi:hypothetical protein